MHDLTCRREAAWAHPWQTKPVGGFRGESPPIEMDPSRGRAEPREAVRRTGVGPGLGCAERLECAALSAGIDMIRVPR